MFAFSGLAYTVSMNGCRIYSYDTPDALEEVLSRGYFRGVGELFAEGDSIAINAADGSTKLPLLDAPLHRDAPSALVH
jgi:hypothetical protein